MTVAGGIGGTPWCKGDRTTTTRRGAGSRVRGVRAFCYGIFGVAGGAPPPPAARFARPASGRLLLTTTLRSAGALAPAAIPRTRDPPISVHLQMQLAQLFRV